LGATLLSRKPVLPAFQRHLLLEHWPLSPQYVRNKSQERTEC
jgi:hypothetical protein